MNNSPRSVSAAARQLRQVLLEAQGRELADALSRLTDVVSKAGQYLVAAHVGQWSDNSEKHLEAFACLLCDAVELLLEPPRTGPQLSRYDRPGARVPARMGAVAAEIAKQYPKLYEKLALLHDHKGYLEVAWHDKPTAAEWDALAGVWETVGGELSENVRCHHTCPRCRGSGVGNGCRVNG